MMFAMGLSTVAADTKFPGSGALRWGVKKSFRDYVLGAFGEMTVVEPAALERETVVFPLDAAAPPDGALRFQGAVRFRAHHGMLEVLIGDPWIETVEGEARLSVAHGSGRVMLARLCAVEPVEQDGLLVWQEAAARLAKEGGAVFNFPYPEETELDAVSYAAPKGGPR